MWKAWDQHKAQQRHLRYARELVAGGVTFRRIEPTDRIQVRTMVRAYVAGAHGFEFDEDAGGLVAVDGADVVIGALVVNAADFNSQIAVFVRFLVVEPTWRGRGVGVVMVGMIPQILGGQPSVTVGNCAARDARFYQRAGFSVLDSGQRLPFPLGNQALMSNTSTSQPCWFFREW